MTKLTGIAITKEQLTKKADDAIKKFQDNFNEKTGGTITRSMAIVKLLERYSDNNTFNLKK